MGFANLHITFWHNFRILPFSELSSRFDNFPKPQAVCHLFQEGIRTRKRKVGIKTCTRTERKGDRRRSLYKRPAAAVCVG